MKYDSYDKEAIAETLNTYLGLNRDTLPLEFKYAGITKESSDYNVEKYLELYSAEAITVSHKKFVQILMELKNSELLNNYAIKVINKLIGDHKLFKKIQFINDGSYRNNRIWGHEKGNMYTLTPEIGYNLRCAFNKKDPAPIDNPKKYINWLYNHFDILFLQIPRCTQFYTFCNEAEWNRRTQISK